jgi:hypothetical protein
MARFTVTTRADRSDHGDGVLSLREALAAADATPRTHDRILFDLDAMGGERIVLRGRALVAGSPVTIDGGPGVTIDAGQRSRVLETGAEVALAHLTVTGGRESGDNALGGGIFAGADLTLTECTITGNAALGTYSGGGGGIWSTGFVELLRCTVSDNRAEGREGSGDRFYSCVGGGVHGGTLSLVDSTVYGNKVYAADYVDGGGIYADDLTVVGSTVTANRSIANDFAGGGGLASDTGRLAIANSIVAGNLGGWQGVFAASDVDGVSHSNGHNLFGSDVYGDVAADIEGVPVGLIFAGGLADHGGPTLTVALRDAADNPALAGADPAVASTTDQRGETRPLPPGTAPDIGAYELAQSATPSGAILGTNRGETLRGTAGGDLIRSFGGNDILEGLGAGDRLLAGTGDDLLRGGGGCDRLEGGPGADRCVLGATTEAPTGGPVYEELFDFSRSQGDRIDVRRIDSNLGATGDQDFAFIGSGAFTRAGQLRAEAAAGGFLVSGDVDGDEAADFALVVHTELAALRAVDFVL